MSRTTARRISVALAVAAVLAMPTAQAAAAGPGRQAADSASILEQAWRWVADLAGASARVSEVHGRTPARHGLTVVSGKLGGFIDPDGRSALLAKPGVFVSP
jgi:hypothetical protein